MENNHFDSKAAEWDKKKIRRELASAVSAAIAKLPLGKDMEAMDFGCGTGLVSLPLAAKLGRIVALDSSTGMLEMVQQKIDKEKIDNVEPVCGEIDKIEFSRHFDLIFTSMTLHHIDNVDLVLQRFSELLDSGGLLAIADLDQEDGSFHKPGSTEKHHGFNRDHLQEKLARFGFTEISVATVFNIPRKLESGEVKEFPVFLATARKS